ncbi:MAG TPA: ATP-binding protein, partial [Candidatus Dormibacteraeota bacterium]
LRPPALDELGLETAIRQQVDALSERGASSRRGLDILVESSGELRGLPAAVEVAAFRIAAEAVTNVVRHAQASVCTVRLDRDNDLRVEVTDDGRGMGPSRAAGMGLVSMRQRVAELGGTLHVESVHQHGTTVTAVLPLGAGAG